MATREAIKWALDLKPENQTERSSVKSLLGSINPSTTIHEPWRTAWSLIKQSWDYPENGLFFDSEFPEIENICVFRRFRPLIPKESARLFRLIAPTGSD